MARRPWEILRMSSLRAPLRVRGPLPLSLEVPGIVVLTEHLLQDTYLLSDAGMRSRALEESRHELFAVLGRVPERID
jgi:hypothetical protein